MSRPRPTRARFPAGSSSFGKRRGRCRERIQKSVRSFIFLARAPGKEARRDPGAWGNPREALLVRTLWRQRRETDAESDFPSQ